MGGYNTGGRASRYGCWPEAQQRLERKSPKNQRHYYASPPPARREPPPLLRVLANSTKTDVFFNEISKDLLAISTDGCWPEAQQRHTER
ncbi:MAG: hypothetical protein HKN76_22430 [Saprospiraceae bacterium]|nr:hypothetical protein [Saprospiraceae bacterium]